jgi:hypothetical protein
MNPYILTPRDGRCDQILVGESLPPRSDALQDLHIFEFALREIPSEPRANELLTGCHGQPKTVDGVMLGKSHVVREQQLTIFNHPWVNMSSRLQVGFADVDKTSNYE